MATVLFFYWNSKHVELRPSPTLDLGGDGPGVQAILTHSKIKSPAQASREKGLTEISSLGDIYI